MNNTKYCSLKWVQCVRVCVCESERVSEHVHLCLSLFKHEWDTYSVFVHAHWSLSLLCVYVFVRACVWKSEGRWDQSSRIAGCQWTYVCPCDLWALQLPAHSAALCRLGHCQERKQSEERRRCSSRASELQPSKCHWGIEEASLGFHFFHLERGRAHPQLHLLDARSRRTKVDLLCELHVSPQ